MKCKTAFYVRLILIFTLLMLYAMLLCYPIPALAQAESQSSVPPTVATSSSDTKPFTPAGTGTVTDNVTDQDGKEFFSITTEDGNVFYLIIDRQRSNENVYLLNAATESDLMALAQKSDKIIGGSTSAIPEPEPESESDIDKNPPQTQSEDEKPPEQPTKSNNSGAWVLIPVTLIVGGIAYYFKIYKPKQQSADVDDEDMYDDPEDDEESYDEEDI